MSRVSVHVEPCEPAAIARHYVRDVVYGANDGIITTFAVVAGVAGGSLSHLAVLVVGAANLLADGLSMGVGNFLAIRAHEGARAAQDLPEEESCPARHGFATFLAFVIAGAVPLAPFIIPGDLTAQFAWSSALTLAALFAVGAARSLVTTEKWWRTGAEMLAMGAVVAAVAYGAGALAAWALSGP
jgi:VIT1/CCC1 family predicted Fe2+/Mn2+ transporter